MAQHRIGPNLLIYKADANLRQVVEFTLATREWPALRTPVSCTMNGKPMFHAKKKIKGSQRSEGA